MTQDEVKEMLEALGMTGLDVVVIDGSNMFDEIFTVTFPDDRPPIYFNATAIRAAIEANPSLAEKTGVNVSEDNFRHIMEKAGIEEGKIDRLIKRPDIVCQPVLMAEYEDGYICIDGNHRTVLRYALGVDFVDAYLVPKSVWQNYLVDFPEEIAELAVTTNSDGTKRKMK